MIKLTLTILLSLLSTAWAIPNHEVRADQSAAAGFAVSENEISPFYAAVISGTRAPSYQYVEGTITIPEVNYPLSRDPDETVFIAIAWIGLDGFNCEGYIRAGVGIYLSNTGVAYDVVYAFSNYNHGVVKNTNLAPGDQIRFKVSVGRNSISNDFDTERGFVDIDNLTTGETYRRNLSSGRRLCLSTADWYLERYDIRSVDYLKPIPDFGKITWSNTSATTLFEEKVNPRESYGLDLDDGFTLTKTEVTDDSVTFHYDGL